MLGLCSTCLSQDRMVKPLDIAKFTSLFDNKKEVTCSQVDTKVNMVCWECSALFRKLHNFKMQVVHAQRCLQKMILETPTDMQPLTQLSYSKMNCTSVYDFHINSADLVNVDTTISKPDESFPQNDTIKTETENTGDDNFFDDSHLIDSVEAFEIEHTDMKKEIDSFEIECTDMKNEIDSFDTIKETTTRSKANRKRKKISSENVEKKIKKVKINAETSNDADELKKIMNENVKERQNYTIMFMGDEELQAKRERDRQSDRYKKSKYKCESCIYSFPVKDKYEKHMERRHSEVAGNHVCVVCRTRFVRESNLRQHAAGHRRKYVCGCGYVGHGVQEMAQHEVSEHGVPRFACTVCGRHFPTYGTLKYHRMNGHATNKCDTCGKLFKAKSYLATHIELMHGAYALKQCGVCGVKLRHLAAHMRKHQAKPEAAYCAECDIRFASMPIYKSHLKYAAAHNPAESLKRSCNYCEFKTVNLNTLQKHITVKHLKKECPYKCHICDKGFYAKCRLNTHVSVKHEGVERPRDKICHVCGRGFTTKAMLSNHIRVHTGEKPFRCDICDAAFSQKSSLATHTRGVHIKLKTRQGNQPN